MDLTRLNLPNAPLSLKKKHDKIYVRCLIRNKELVCTPEEWVRQHFIHHLIQDHKVKKGRIGVEYSLNYNGLLKRADIVVVDDNGVPQLLVECKAPEVKLSEEVLHQAAGYNFKLNVDHLFLTNGIQHIYCKINREERALEFPEAFDFNLIG